jgi:hypothetical protein
VVGAVEAASLKDDADRLQHLAELAAAALALRERRVAEALSALDHLAALLASINICWHGSLQMKGFNGSVRD